MQVPPFHWLLAITRFEALSAFGRSKDLDGVRAAYAQRKLAELPKAAGRSEAGHNGDKKQLTEARAR
jgi:hypothetical protein